MTTSLFVRVFLCLAGLVVVSGELLAAAQQERPRIGLALSGGGARGAAHVGVLKELERLRIPIDYIAGTSMGSIVGGLYAAGMSPDQIERELAAMDWDALFQDDAPRPERNYREKADDVAFQNNLRVGVRGVTVKVGSSLIAGQHFDQELKRLTLPVSHIDDFDKLTIPFRCVATDLVTGDRVVLARGDLSRAIRASMAVPGAFGAVEMDGHLLVDGGMVANLPISVVREMGADIVIAVDIGGPLLDREGVQDVFGVVYQLTGFLTVGNTKREIATLTDRDILIAPDLGDITSSDFKRSAEAIAAGLEGAQARSVQLARLGVDAGEYARRMAGHRFPDYRPPMVDFIEIHNEVAVSEETIRAHLGLEVGQPFDHSEVERGIDRLYGLGLFEGVRYDLVDRDGRSGVVIYATEKRNGTSFLQFGLKWAAENGSGSGSYFNVSAAVTGQPMNELAGHWRLAVQVGEEPYVISEWYQPLNPAGEWFGHVLGGWDNQVFNFYQGDDPIAQYRYERLFLTLAGGRTLGRWGEFRIGYTLGSGDLGREIGDVALPEGKISVGHVFARLRIDTFDSLDFPTKGSLGRFEIRHSNEALGADDDYSQAEFNFARAWSFGDNVLIGRAQFGYNLDDDSPVYASYRLGGFQRLSGLDQYQLLGRHAGLVSAVYMHRIYQSQVVPVFAGASLEYGGVWNDSGDIGQDMIVAGSLFLGVDTPIGPVYLGYGQADQGRNNIYLFMGHLF